LLKDGKGTQPGVGPKDDFRAAKLLIAERALNTTFQVILSAAKDLSESFVVKNWVK
jgi:hypothetical protein